MSGTSKAICTTKVELFVRELKKMYVYSHLELLVVNVIPIWDKSHRFMPPHTSHEN